MHMELSARQLSQQHTSSFTSHRAFSHTRHRSGRRFLPGSPTGGTAQCYIARGWYRPPKSNALHVLPNTCEPDRPCHQARADGNHSNWAACEETSSSDKNKHAAAGALLTCVQHSLARAECQRTGRCACKYCLSGMLRVSTWLRCYARSTSNETFKGIQYLACFIPGSSPAPDTATSPSDAYPGGQAGRHREHPL
jgi:hypothetical protein